MAPFGKTCGITRSGDRSSHRRVGRCAARGGHRRRCARGRSPRSPSCRQIAHNANLLGAQRTTEVCWGARGLLIRRALSSAFAKGLPPSLAKRFISDKP